MATPAQMPTPQPMTPTVPQAPPRPWNVTFIAIVGCILTALGFLSGIAEAVFSADLVRTGAFRYGQSSVIVGGIIFSVIALIMFILWIRFFNGHRGARLVLAIFVVLHMVVMVAAMFTFTTAVHRIGFAISILLEFVCLAFMYAGNRTSQYFAPR